MTIYGPDLETEGTDPFEDSILTIQYRNDETQQNHLYKRWEYGSERELIFDFLMDYKDITWSRQQGGPLRVGYRVTDFDLPFLLTRCYESRVFEELRAGPGFVWTNVISGPAYLDLSHLLGGDMVSFEDWRAEFLNTESPSSGEEIPMLYERDEYAKIEQYVTDELEALEEVYTQLRSTDYFRTLMEMRRDIGFKRELR